MHITQSADEVDTFLKLGTKLTHNNEIRYKQNN